MIAFVRGLLSLKEPNKVIVDVGGIGYEVSVPISTFEKLPDTDQEVKLLTCQIVREKEFSLYGFATSEELMVFKLVLSVSGAGPKAALGILSKVSPSRFKSAILNDDVPTLKSAPGIGTRTAQRLIVELKDKVDLLPGEAEETGVAVSDAVNQAIAAIRELGSTKTVAERAVHQASQILGKDASLEEIVRLALRFTI
jgi:Holliday junction DNA helicase RuvA